MNTVILLNPNQNVKIKNTVKEILKKINLENFYFLPEKPVLIDISHFYSEEKNLKEEIQKITVKNAVLKDLQLFFPVEIILKNKSFSEKVGFVVWQFKDETRGDIV